MIYIRADANEMIGTGHVMRCLSIAKEAQKAGQDVTFIFADERTKQLIEQQGFSGICLHSAWDDLEQEIESLVTVIEQNEIEVLLIDSYYVTEKYLSALRNYVQIVYIDDLHTMVYPVDLLINYNIYSSKYAYEEEYSAAGYDTTFLLGCRYVPLREEFANVVRSIKMVPDKILITSGGTDKYNVLGHLMAELKRQMWFKEFEYYVVMGRFNGHIEKLEAECKNDANIHLLQNISNISDYMRECDIAITAGGVTTYELCASGIPSIMYTIADNQLEIAQTFSESGIIPWVGDVRKDINQCMTNIVQKIVALKSDVCLRKVTSQRMQQMVDGNGSKRIIERYLCKKQ